MVSRSRVALVPIAGLVVSLLAGCASASTPPVRPASPSSTPSSSMPARPAHAAPPSSTVLVWSFSAYSASTVHKLRSAIGSGFTPVHVGLLPLRSGVQNYPESPVEAIGVVPPHFAAAMGTPSLASDLRHGAVVSQTEARLRGLSAGDRMHLVGGDALRISAVVADEAVGGYEVALPMKRARKFGVRLTEYALVAHVHSLKRVRREVHDVVGSERTRVRRAGVRPFLRHGDDVLPQQAIEEKFGSFPLRRSSGEIALAPSWVHRHIVTARVPILGHVTCNRALIPHVRAVMRDLERHGLARLVDPSQYGGCFNARAIRGSSSELSRHSWGAAIDINVGSNPLGSRGHQDPRLVAAFARHGFTWGGRWITRRDPQHFEWVGHPAAYGG
jgi:hypothetical protein